MNAAIWNFITPLFQPLGAIWMLLSITAVISVTRKQRSTSVAIILVWIVVTLVGSTPLPNVLLGSLERPYLGRTVAAAQPGDAVLMLGGGISFSPNDSFHIVFNESSSRIVTAVEAIRQHKGGVLVLGGGGYLEEGRTKSESALLRDFLESWKVCDTPIIPLEPCRNTHDEVLGLEKRAREQHWRRIVLVTSALHLHRAEGLFRQIGLPVEVIACDFKVAGVQRPFRSIFPGIQGFEYLDLYLHEKLGWYLYLWRGWVKDAATSG